MDRKKNHKHKVHSFREVALFVQRNEGKWTLADGNLYRGFQIVLRAGLEPGQANAHFTKDGRIHKIRVEAKNNQKQYIYVDPFGKEHKLFICELPKSE